MGKHRCRSALIVGPAYPAACSGCGAVIGGESSAYAHRCQWGSTDKRFKPTRTAPHLGSASGSELGEEVETMKACRSVVNNAAAESGHVPSPSGSLQALGAAPGPHAVTSEEDAAGDVAPPGPDDRQGPEASPSVGGPGEPDSQGMVTSELEGLISDGDDTDGEWSDWWRTT